MSFLALSNVSYGYKNAQSPLIKNLNMHVDKGEIVCLVGVSGSGKTTLLNLISGLIRPSEGRISINDNIVSSADICVPIENRQIAFVFQQPVLFPNQNAIENVAYAINSGSNKSRLLKSAQLLKMMHMQDHLRANPNNLSLGQRQRVALARALAQGVELLLLDEPFASLDVAVKRHLRKELLEIMRLQGKTVLFVTHDPADALMLADRIYVIDDGEIIQDGVPEDLYKNPVNAFVAGFFSEYTQVSAVVKNGSVETDFGVMDANGFADGAKLICCFRADAFSLEDGGSFVAKVAYSRFMGRDYAVYFIPEGSSTSYVLFCGESMKQNQQIRLSLNRNAVFLFPDNTQTTGTV